MMPREIYFELSSDGHTYRPGVTVPVNVPEREYGVIIKELAASFPDAEARYVRVKARTYGKLPSWHPGSGGDAWIFVDEIIVE
jgi:hypothetical protein